MKNTVINILKNTRGISDWKVTNTLNPSKSTIFPLAEKL